MGPGVASQPKLVPALCLEHLLQRHPDPLGSFLRLLHPVLDLVVDQAVGELHLHPVDQLREDALPELGVRSFSHHAGEFLPDVGSKLLDGVELRRGLGELVVGGGKTLGLHLLDQHPERHLLAGLIGEALRQGRVELKDLSLALPLELLVQLRHELLGPHLVQVLLP